MPLIPCFGFTGSMLLCFLTVGPYLCTNESELWRGALFLRKLRVRPLPRFSREMWKVAYLAKSEDYKDAQQLKGVGGSSELRTQK